jgi:hypothetical protein
LVRRRLKPNVLPADDGHAMGAPTRDRKTAPKRLLRRIRLFGIPSAVAMYPLLWVSEGPGSHELHPLSATAVVLLASLYLAWMVAMERYVAHVARAE